ncbi:MAG: deoxyribodipyrimidine photo-lyase, partial [Saprospiraceae bacterium]|nr:deoxyribodipyrimidine photo-lyase [Saprospiraceae bacterium]
MGSEINIVWLKRDLRLRDHAPLELASQRKVSLLILYIFEPELIHHPDYDIRHWRFVWQSIQDLNKQLAAMGQRVHVQYGNALDIFKKLSALHIINTVFSHQEIGVQTTFQRDQVVGEWFHESNIKWHETPHSAVIRGLKSRKNWKSHWQK